LEKILIIGASGLTGFKLTQLAVNDFEVYGTYNHRPVSLNQCTFYQLDKTEKNKTNRLIKKISPNVVVDCSALHNVDYCEIHKEESWKINTESTKNIADLCKEINARMIFISTDYVYDGKDETYTEESPTNPLNYYGLCKLRAEEEITNTGISYAIGRTSLVFGWNPGEILGKKSSSGKTMNFVIWALNKLRNNENITIVSDQFSTPTFADNLAEFLLALAKSNKNGVFHTVGNQCINRYDFTLKIADTFELDRRLISQTTSDSFKQVAKRPMRCCLNSTKTQHNLKIKALSIEEALKLMKKQEIEN
jgi:dTDP-4-dehydrorhamnose reductase